jgi:hypothetical protein
MITDRLRARRIMNSLCIQTYGLGLDDLPDLPCVMYALDEMEQMIEEEGEQVSIAELQNIAQDAISELVDDGWL